MLEVFGVHLTLVPSTSPVPGKLSASVIATDGSVKADLFLWDPMSSVVQFDEGQLHQLLHEVKKAQRGWASIVLWVTDLVISVVNGLRAVCGGSYGGSLGFGQMGSIVTIASAMLFVVATILAAVVVIPLSLITWLLRRHINGQIRLERAKAINQAIAFFERAQEPALN